MANSVARTGLSIGPTGRQLEPAHADVGEYSVEPLRDRQGIVTDELDRESSLVSSVKPRQEWPQVASLRSSSRPAWKGL